jgi:putative ABC transport system ATP-binding protein
VKEPTVLLADEPTGALDEQTRDEIIDLLEGVKADRGLTLVIVTHDSWIAKGAKRRLHIKQGKVTEKQSDRETRTEGNAARTPFDGASTI